MHEVAARSTGLKLACFILAGLLFGGCAPVGVTSNAGSAAASTASAPAATPAPAAATPPPAPSPTAAQSATLTWVAPTENTDGTVLTGLAGYHIYYGTSADALTTEVDVADAATTTYVVNGLAAGTYYFAVAAYTAMGTESAQSDIASKTI